MDNITSPSFSDGDGGRQVNLGLAIALPICLVAAIILVLIFFFCIKYHYHFWIAVPQHREPEQKPGRDQKKGVEAEKKSRFWIESTLPGAELATDALSPDVSMLNASLLSEGPGEWYRAIHQYETREEGRLPLDIGQLVEVKEKLDAGWWLGLSNTNVGWFPATYVEPLSGHYNPMLQTSFTEETEKGETPLKPACPSDLQRTPDGQKSYTAVCIYKPHGSDELAVSPGDILFHVNRDPNGWVKVRHKVTDEVGWVPMATLEEATTGVTTSPQQTPLTKEGSEGHITGIECVSLFKYEGVNEGDLSFEAGEAVVAVQILDNGWWRGYHNNKEGWFAGSYVQIIPLSPTSVDSGCTSPRLANNKVRVNLSKSFDEAGMAEKGAHMNGAARNGETSHHRPLLDRLRVQMNPSRVLHPRVVRIHANQLRERISNQLKRINVPPPPAPPRTSPPVTMLAFNPAPLHNNNEQSTSRPDDDPKQTAMILEGVETGATLDTGETPGSSEEEYGDYESDDAEVLHDTPSPQSPSLTTFDKIVIEKALDPEEERQKKESLERAQQLLADLQKSAPKKYSLDTRETLTDKYLKNKGKRSSESQEKSPEVISESSSSLYKKIALNSGEMFDLNLVETLAIESDSKSESSDCAFQLHNSGSNSTEEFQVVVRSDDEGSILKAVFGEKRASSSSGDSRSSSWGSRRDVPVVAVRPVGHENTDSQYNSEVKVDSEKVNKESDTWSSVISDFDKDSKEKRESGIFNKMDYDKLFSGLDDFNPSFELETNVDDVMEDEVVRGNERNSQLRGSRNSKDLKLLIPPPAEFVDWSERQDLGSDGEENRHTQGSSPLDADTSPNKPTDSVPVAPKRRRRKEKRPQAPPPPPPSDKVTGPGSGDSTVSVSLPVSAAPTVMLSTSVVSAAPPAIIACPVVSTAPVAAISSTLNVTTVSSVSTTLPVVNTSPPILLTPPTISPLPTMSLPSTMSPPPSMSTTPTVSTPSTMLMTPTISTPPTMSAPQTVSTAPTVPMPPTVPTPPKRKIQKSDKPTVITNENINPVITKPVMDQTSNVTAVNDCNETKSVSRPFISDPIPTPELVNKPHVSNAIPLTRTNSKSNTLPNKRQSLPTSSVTIVLPRHMKYERSNSLPQGTSSLPASPVKPGRSGNKRPAPLPPLSLVVSAPVSPAKPLSPSKAGLKVTFSENLIIHNDQDPLGPRPARPPPPRQSPSPNSSPTKSILVRGHTDSDVRKYVIPDASAGWPSSGVSKGSLRRVWRSYVALSKGELSLSEDCLIRELEAAPGKEGYFIGMTLDGQIGTFPRSCVVVEDERSQIQLQAVESTMYF